MTRATMEVHHSFYNTTPQFGSLRKSLPKTYLEQDKAAAGWKITMAYAHNENHEQKIAFLFFNFPTIWG